MENKPPEPPLVTAADSVTSGGGSLAAPVSAAGPAPPTASPTMPSPPGDSGSRQTAEVPGGSSSPCEEGATPGDTAGVLSREVVATGETSAEEAAAESGSPQRPVADRGAPQESVGGGGSPQESAGDGGSPQESAGDGGSPQELLAGSGSSQDSTADSALPQKTNVVFCPAKATDKPLPQEPTAEDASPQSSSAVVAADGESPQQPAIDGVPSQIPAAESASPPGSGAAEGAPEPMEAGSEDGREAAAPGSEAATTENEADRDLADLSLSESSYTEDSDEDMAEDETELAEAMEDMKKKAEEIMKKPKPKHTWSLVKELHKRQQGDRPSVLHQDRFRLHLHSSLHAVERLELMDKLCFHEGCVNCLHFNQSGELLASGSDDLNVVVWDWQRHRKAYYYNSGHKSNIFEAKFLPLRGDTHIVSTSRDGQVRLAEISPAGECRSVRRLAQHRGSGRKLALPAHSPHTVLSCGEDGVVFNIDLRQRQPDKLTTCIDFGKKIATNSIAAHPYDDDVFLLACVDKFVRVYDRRMIGTEQQAFRRFCPHKLLESGRRRVSVTCAVFSHDGSEIAASYNDDDVYLFDASHSDGADAVRQYSGHRNSATTKGVNFYDPTSRYVVSGSDCGNIFFWDKETEAIVQCMPGDEKGVVNCLEPHPYMPVLATSGLDDDVKLWIASNDQPPELPSLRETVERNLRERVEGSPSTDALGGSLMWTLMQQVFGSQRRRHQLFSVHSHELDLRSSDDSAEEDGPGDCRPT